ncbi:hypothetical protein ACRYI5_10880 [Furfurilactobacillus sp. WILCCON 0119]
MLQTHGDLYEGVTNLPDLSHESVVTYQTERLKSYGEGTFNAVMMSTLSMLQADIVNNGKKYRALVKAGQVRYEDAPNFEIHMDEVQTLLTPQHPTVARFIAEIMEQMRKNFCAMVMGAPSVQGIIIPSEPGKKDTPYQTDIKKIFELTNYRCFFHMAPEDIPLLRSALQKSISDATLSEVSELEKGSVFMNISGYRSLVFHVQPSDEQLARFDGGK